MAVYAIYSLKSDKWSLGFSPAQLAMSWVPPFSRPKGPVVPFSLQARRRKLFNPSTAVSELGHSLVPVPYSHACRLLLPLTPMTLTPPCMPQISALPVWVCCQNPSCDSVTRARPMQLSTGSEPSSFATCLGEKAEAIRSHFPLVGAQPGVGIAFSLASAHLSLTHFLSLHHPLLTQRAVLGRNSFVGAASKSLSMVLNKHSFLLVMLIRETKKRFTGNRKAQKKGAGLHLKPHTLMSVTACSSSRWQGCDKRLTQHLWWVASLHWQWGHEVGVKLKQRNRRRDPE